MRDGGGGGEGVVVMVGGGERVVVGMGAGCWKVCRWDGVGIWGGEGVVGWWVGIQCFIGEIDGWWVVGAGRDGGGRGSIDTVVTVGSLCELRKYMENICPHLSLGKAWFEES